MSVVFDVLVDRMCPEEILEGITYEETIAGGSVTLQCPDGAEGQITRECSLSGEWNDPVNTCGTWWFLLMIRSSDVQSRIVWGLFLARHSFRIGS